MAMLTTAAEGAAWIAERCDKAHQTKDSWTACCPAHEDRTPSLSITPAGNRILLHCFSGCAPEVVAAALGLTLADLFVDDHRGGLPPPRRPPVQRQSAPPAAAAAKAPAAGRPRHTATYDYTDAHHTLLHQVLRWEPGFHGEKKSFTQRRPHPTKPGVWIKNLDGIKRVLYNLPAVLRAVQAQELIYLPEGEQDANKVIALGLPATTNAGGADQWEDQYTDTLRGAHVVILQDNDDAGRRHTALVTQALHGAAASLKVVELPGLADKGDVSDWLQAGGTRAQLEAIVAQTPVWAPGAMPAAQALPPRQPYVKPGPPVLPRSAFIAPCHAEGAAPWLEAYMTHSRYWAPWGMEAAHQAVGLWVLSTIAARRVFISMGPGQVYPSLFLAMVAESTLYAKSTTAMVGMQLLERAGGHCFLAADQSTPQALLRSMSGVVPASYGTSAEEAREQIRGRLAFAAQRGWYFDEWGHLLPQIRRPESAMAGFHGFLRVLDDGRAHFANETIQRGLEEIRQPYLSLLTASTESDLAPFMTPGSSWWRDGFWPRFAFITPRADEDVSLAPFPQARYTTPSSLVVPLYTWHTALGIPSVTVEDLTESQSGKPAGVWRATVSALPQRELGLSAAACAAYEAYLITLRTMLHQGVVAQDLFASYARLPTKALRIALLLAAFQGGERIDIRHWAYAQAVVESWRVGLHTLRDRVGELGQGTLHSQEEDRIIHILTMTGRATAREIRRHIKGMTSEKLLRLLAAMEKTGQIHQQSEGRQTWYALVPRDKDAEDYTENGDQNEPSF